MTDIHTGQLLLAEPFMPESHFKRSAILICDHNAAGSVGFVLNKQLDVNVDDLIEDFPEFPYPIYYGGPVQQDTIHYIHRMGDLVGDCQEVVNGIYWGGDYDKIKFLISQGLITNKDIRFFVGYAGWTGGQIAKELDYGSWVVANMYANYLFKTPPNDLWQQAMENKGNIYSVIAQVPDNSVLN
ncbi:MAG: YqgE/AlgH family protein [Bacteroidota bacterium]